ncbi:MAG: metalloprotease TldD, partial [Klebsiella quasipneumoniae]|nr:metalloprotease TldD [Klebsiella quasipneumoniae]
MIKNNTDTAIEALLTANDLTLQDLSAAFAHFSGKGIDFADFYFQRTVSEGYVLEEGIVKSGDYSTDMGVGVRAVSGEKSALAYSDEISKAALLKAVDTVKVIGHGTGGQKTVDVSRKDAPSPLYHPINPIELKEASFKIEL